MGRMRLSEVVLERRLRKAERRRPSPEGSRSREGRKIGR